MQKELPQWQQTYKTDPKELARTKYWLLSSQRKLLNAETKQKIQYELSTSFWQLLSLFFLKANMPVPANSDMYRLAPTLMGEARFEDLLGTDVRLKKELTLELINELTVQQTVKRM